MSKIAKVAGLLALVLVVAPSGFSKTADAKNGTIVLVFKDGHRQTFSLADIARVEFPGESGAADAGLSSQGMPPRGHFVGKWEVGDGMGNNFFITLNETGDAIRSLGGDVHGRWVYVNGEARITWDDGAKDTLRKVGSRDQKSAYGSGKSFTDAPDNTANARNTTHRPI